MTAFIWLFVAAQGLQCVCLLILLAMGRMPVRTPGGMAIDLVVGLFWIGWAVWLLAKA